MGEYSCIIIPISANIWIKGKSMTANFNIFIGLCAHTHVRLFWRIPRREATEGNGQQFIVLL